MQSSLPSSNRYRTWKNCVYQTPTLSAIRSFQYLPIHCPHLTSVELHCQLTNASMHTLGQHCQHLTHLTLTNMPHLNYAALLDLFHDCPLTQINIYPATLTSSARPSFIESATLGLHHHHQHTLTLLYIDVAGDAIMNMINTHKLAWPHLAHFSLDRCHQLTDAMATAFFQLHPKLRHLYLEHSDQLTDHFLDNVVRYLPDLRLLGVKHNPQLTASGICRMIRRYGGKLTGDVNCEGCEIYPDDDDFPQDIDDMYCLAMDDDGKPEVIWFSGNAIR